uniref:BTB domain-containing protein n=1 Tax=Bracon brevicornis TaxID=1563983 RepID=A0A6V7K0X7_9HYME
MQLQPMTELSPDFIGIYLHLISSKMYGMQIQLKFDLTTMDMKKIRSIDPLVHKFDGPNSIGFPSVDLRSNVLTGLGTEEDLMISCSLTVTANATMTPCDEIETSPESSSEPLKEEESNNFRHLYLNSDQSDVTIVIENETIPAHKFILSARCPIFADIFEAAGGIDINSLVIEGMDLAEVKGLLEFIYKDEVSNLEELAEGLLRAADAYELPKLRTLCEGIMYDRLTETSAAQLLILAHVCHADDLKTKVLVFIADHLNGVAASEGYKDIVLYPELLDEIIRSTAQKNSSEGSIESVGETLIKDSGGRMQTTTHVTL